MERKNIFPVKSDSGDYIKECVADASKIISAYWPISTFIASNGLANLEDLPFEEAVKQGEHLRGSSGFLPLATYRQFLTAGRISEKELDAVISSTIEEQTLPKSFLIGDKRVVTSWLIKRWLLENLNAGEVKEHNKSLWEAVYNRLEGQNLLDYPETETISEKTFNSSGHPITEAVDRRMITFCAAFLDEGQAAWKMPGREQGFYKCWKELAGLEGGPGKKLIRKRVQILPDAPEVALAELLTELEIPQDEWKAYLTRHLAQLPGWASLIRWRQEHPETHMQQEFPVNLVEYLTVRVFYEAILVQVQQKAGVKPANQESTIEKHNAEKVCRLVMLLNHLELSPADVAAISDAVLVKLADKATTINLQSLWQEAFEYNFRQQLLSGIAKSSQESTLLKAPAAQAIFCIDVRSEGLRRQIEQSGAYETFGFAGFFGVPMLYRPFGSSCDIVVAPALLTPTQPITEVATGVSQKTIERNLAHKRRRYKFRELLHSLKENLLTPFAFVEMVGWFSVFPLVGKTLLPGKWRKMQAAINSKMAPEVPVVPSTANNEAVMTYRAQAQTVAGMLRSIGLTKDFARLVLICGHGSETENNPYASALDCGACGGNHGGNSAFVAANMLNTPQVRKILAEQGIVIPAQTYFLAGEHNTTTDTINFSSEADIPESHRAEFEKFKLNVAEAGKRAALERWRKLSASGAKLETIGQQVAQRAADWAQLRPEWGLVRNAAFICGSRKLTSSLNLDNRAFLHSYDQSQDSTGAVLEGIMTAPVVVAEWINMQYYLSSVDNQRFGSGTKLLHTVVGQVGVMQGRHSDLLTGLPQQSVMLGEELFHEPLRLSVILEANPDKISTIIGKHEKLQQLTQNKWITLVAYDSVSNIFYQYTPKGHWVELVVDNSEEVVRAVA